MSQLEREKAVRLAAWLDNQATAALKKNPIVFDDRKRWAAWARKAASLMRKLALAHDRPATPTKAKPKPKAKSKTGRPR